MMSYKTPVLIIGGGPAGYTAAIYAARASLNPILLTGLQPGGQLTITTDVENYPGFADTIQGPWLMEQMRQQAAHVGTDIKEDTISRVDFSKRPFMCYGDNVTYEAETVIICTGAQARWLGLESESKFRGFGVSGCATCDGFFFRNKDVAIIGGGNTAVEEALYMTNHAKQVTLIHRRDQLRAEKVLQERLFAHPKIRVVWNTIVDEIIGTEAPLSVNRIRLKDVEKGSFSELDVDGVFVAIGHTPATACFQGHIELDPEGYIVGPTFNTETSVPGVFAAGDVKDKIYRQAVTAAGMGCMAALDVARFLQDNPLK